MQTLEEILEEFCPHQCTSKCRREGCICNCGDLHSDVQAVIRKAYSSARIATLEEVEKIMRKISNKDMVDYDVIIEVLTTLKENK